MDRPLVCDWILHRAAHFNSFTAKKPTRIQLAEELIAPARTHVRELVEDLEERDLLLCFIEKWSSVCAEELIPLMGEAKIDPRFTRALICELNEDGNRE